MGQNHACPTVPESSDIFHEVSTFYYQAASDKQQKGTVSAASGEHMSWYFEIVQNNMSILWIGFERPPSLQDLSLATLRELEVCTKSAIESVYNIISQARIRGVL